MDTRLQCYIPSHKVIGPLVLKKISEGFLPYMGVAASLVKDLTNKLLFPQPMEAPHEIWLWLAKWFWRRRSLKMVDGPWLYYKLTVEPKGSGELNMHHFTYIHTCNIYIHKENLKDSLELIKRYFPGNFKTQYFNALLKEVFTIRMMISACHFLSRNLRKPVLMTNLTILQRNRHERTDKRTGNTKTIIQPQHDKTNKMICGPSEDTDQPGHPSSPIRVFAVRSLGS